MTTGVLFVLLVVAHIWRVAEEGIATAKSPVFLFSTIVATGMTLWSLQLLRKLASAR